MQKVLLLLALLAVIVNCSLAQKTKQFDYRIEPVIQGEQSHFIITVSFKQKEQGEIRFLFPKVWGMDKPADIIQFMQVKNASYEQNEEAITLKCTKNSDVTLVYRLNNAVSDSIPGRDQEYLPVIKPTYFTLFTNSALLVPDDQPGIKYNFSLYWKNYPEGYRSKPITSFGNGLKQELKQCLVEDLQNGILAGGDYRVYRQISDKKQITHFAIRGKWAFKDEELGQLIESTLRQQRTFWEDYSTKNYLILISAGGYENELEHSYTGTGLQNSFAVTAMCNNTMQVKSLQYLFHHELMHHWIGNQIKNGVDEELSYWFSEGFTDYFSRKNMYESHLITEEQYTALLDSVLAVHYSNPLATAHNDSIQVHFWEPSYYGKLPYNRGSIFAYYLDGKIQHLSNGQYDLKDVMRRMLSQTKTEKQNFDWNWIQQEIRNLVNDDFTPDFTAYIVDGELIPISVLNKNLYNQLELRSVKVFAIGFSMEKDPVSGKSLITGITKNSGAEAAGILVGDQVKRYSIYGNTYEQNELTVIRDGKELTIPFYAYEFSNPLPQHIKK